MTVQSIQGTMDIYHSDELKPIVLMSADNNYIDNYAKQCCFQVYPYNHFTYDTSVIL